MKSIFAYSLFALLSPLTLAGSDGPQKLRAITSRSVEPPINDFLEIVGDEVVVAANDDAKGFEYTLEEGELTTPAAPGKGYIKPAPGGIEGLFTFHVGTIPPAPNFLIRDFVDTSKGCGSHCGGPQLVFDRASDPAQNDGDWYALPRDGDGYSVLWYDGDMPLGGNYTVIYLMREDA